MSILLILFRRGIWRVRLNGAERERKGTKQLIPEIEKLRGSISILESDKQMLERPGFNALTAPHGRNAVKHFRKHSEDTVPVILNLIMPHLNSEETFRKLQLIRKNVRVVMCSGYNEQKVTGQFAGRSLAGFLHKPYMFNDLETVIKKVLEKQA